MLIRSLGEQLDFFSTNKVMYDTYWTVNVIMQSNVRVTAEFPSNATDIIN
jgi:hypothetical protein